MDFECSYSHMKTKMQNAIRENLYFTLLLCADEMMFEYENLPESIDPKFLEDYLNISGSAGICRDPSGGYLVCPYPSRAEQLNQYGDGLKLQGATMNGLIVSGEIGKDAAIIYNNTARGRQWDLPMDAAAFADIDKSCGINVLFARIAPIYSTPNDNIKNALKEIIGKVIDGQVDVVSSQNVYDALQINPSENSLKMIDITDPEKIRYIQYLDEHYDAMMRRHFSRRGLSLRTGTKAAQQSRDEIYGMDSVSWYMPLNKLKARQQGFDVFNRIFGENVQVHFSDIWEQEYAAYQLRLLQSDAEAENAAAAAEEAAADDAEGSDNNVSDRTEKGD